MAKSRFFIGEIVNHQKFGYRGVIFAVDAEFSLTDEWYEEVARSRPPKNEPWYHVLVDEQLHSTYVAQRHLEASKNLSQIDHPNLGDYFVGFDGKGYLPRQTVH